MTKSLGKEIKKDFPVLTQERTGKPLVFLDSGASSQKPQVVIDAIQQCYEQYYANVHRGIYQLSEQASVAYEAVRDKVRNFIGAGSTSEIIFTRNTTESINLVAYTWGRTNIGRGDEIVLTEMEHHANIVPWQQLAKERGAIIHYIPLTTEGRLDLEAFKKLLNDKTRLVAMTHMSNVLGTINPVKEMIKTVREQTDAVVLIDGAQSVPHFYIHVAELDADFYAFSAHKMLGPSGVGVLYGKEALLEKMQPFLTGGDMISRVTFDHAEWNDLPWKFEAGTPNIEGVIGFGAALDYLDEIGMDAVVDHEELLTQKALNALQQIEGITIYGPQDTHDRGGVISFTIGNVHPHDMASIFDEQGIAIRAGNHCAQPLHEKLGVPATARVSFYIYNTLDDIDALLVGIQKTQEIFNT